MLPDSDTPVGATNAQSGPPECSLSDFFLSVPAGGLRSLASASLIWANPVVFPGQRIPGYRILELPQIELVCSTEKCGGSRWFSPIDKRKVSIVPGHPEKVFLTYRCNNCSVTTTTYAVLFKLTRDEALLGYKFGEYPLSVPWCRPGSQNCLKSDAELFRKAWNAEKLGFGMAAVTYYRKIIEKHKQQTFDKVIEVAKAGKLRFRQDRGASRARNDKLVLTLLGSR